MVWMSEIPKGWKLVPIEPTLGMVSRGADIDVGHDFDAPAVIIGNLAAREVWAAMLGAVPPPPPTPSQTDPLR